MPDPSQVRRRSALARDGAVRRLRRATQISIATMVALGGGFAALAAGSTHTKTAAVHRTEPPVPATVVTAPAPPLVGSLDEQPAATPSPAPAAPVPSYQPPVVSSGGS